MANDGSSIDHLRNAARALRKWRQDEEELVRLPASPVPGFSARYFNDCEGYELKVRTLSEGSDGQREYRLQYQSWDKKNPTGYTADGVPESWPFDGEESFTIRTDDIGGLLTDIQLDLSLFDRNSTLLTDGSGRSD